MGRDRPPRPGPPRRLSPTRADIRLMQPILADFYGETPSEEGLMVALEDPAIYIFYHAGPGTLARIDIDVEEEAMWIPWVLPATAHRQARLPVLVAVIQLATSEHPRSGAYTRKATFQTEQDARVWLALPALSDATIYKEEGTWIMELPSPASDDPADPVLVRNRMQGWPRG